MSPAHRAMAARVAITVAAKVGKARVARASRARVVSAAVQLPVRPVVLAAARATRASHKARRRVTNPKATSLMMIRGIPHLLPVVSVGWTMSLRSKLT